MRVLYVEDDTTLGRTIERMLLLEGYSCHWATTGEKAVKFGQANEFDVILLDIGLPDMDGYEVIARLRDLDVDKPFLIQSGLVPREQPGDELGFGVEDFLIKPFNRKELFEQLGKAVSRHKRRRDGGGDRRRHKRKEDWETAELEFADGTVAPCTIFSRSSRGGAIKIAKAAGCWTKPFTLKTTDGGAWPCRTCWQFGNKVGVRFV